MLRLQVLISTYGSGIKSIAERPHPRVEGVEYIVSWQRADMRNLPDSIALREDFKIYPTQSEGLGANRRDCLRHATAPYVVISDDDLSYRKEDLEKVVGAFERNPEYSFLTFSYESPDAPREFPNHEFDFDSKPAGYFVTSFEIGINRKRIEELDGNTEAFNFNPYFGINAEFCSGEEDVMLRRLEKRGHRGRYIPQPIAIHPGATTGMRCHDDPGYLEAKGAVMSYLFPHTWTLRMLTHAWRERKNIGFAAYCRHWLRGVGKARKLKAFDETVYSK